MRLSSSPSRMEGGDGGNGRPPLAAGENAYDAISQAKDSSTSLELEAIY